MSMATQQARPSRLATYLANPEAKERIKSLVADFMDAEQFISHMVTAFQDPEIQKCDDVSKFEAVHVCAAMGLLPTLDQVRLIPYRNKCTAMPQWQGYKALMERHPAILEVSAHLVHNSDVFSFKDGVVAHEYDPFDTKRIVKDISDIRGGYCVILYRDGRRPKYHFTTAAHVTKARACAMTRKIWDAWTEQMCLKTCYRDCYARRAVPIDPIFQQRLATATRADDAILGNDPRRIATRRQTVAIEDLTGEVVNQEVDDSQDGIDEQPERTHAPTGPDPLASEAHRREYIDLLPTISTVGACDAYSKQAEHDETLTDEDKAKVVAECGVRAKVIKGHRGPQDNRGAPQDNRLTGTDQ